MDIDTAMVGLSSGDVLVRRGSAKALSEVSESDPSRFTESNIEEVAGVLRETDDTLTLEHLLLAMGNIAGVRLHNLIKLGLLRVATDIFIKNMSAVGLHISRDAIRLISILAPSDVEGAKKIGIVKLIVRTLENSTDTCIRWYALLTLRKIDPSVLQSGVQDIVTYSTKAMAKENDEDTRLFGASALLVVASVAPQALGGSRATNTLVEALTKDLSTDVQACVALALFYIARGAPSQLRETRIGEALFETMMKKLKVVKTSPEKEEEEVFITVASTVAMLALKDAAALGGGKTTRQFDPIEAVLRAIDESRGVETHLRSVLFSILEDISERAPQYIKSRKTVEALVKILEDGGEEDNINNQIVWILRRTASVHPVLFGGADVLEKLAGISLNRATKGGKREVGSGPDPLIIFQTLVESERGMQEVAEVLSKLSRESVVVRKLSEAERWKRVFSSIERRERSKETEQRTGLPGVTVKAERKESRLTEEQRNSLLEILRTTREIPISELATKLDVDQEALRGILDRLSQSGKISMTIEGGILYFGKRPRSP